MFLTTLLPYLMPDGTEGGGAAGGEGSDGGNGQQGDGNDGQPGGAAQTGTQAAGASTPPSANKLIKDFVKEHGLTIEELLSDYTSLKDANKTELERLTGQVQAVQSKYEQATAELQNLRSEAAFLEAAREARARAPKTLFRAFRDQLEFDKQGNPTNIADVIAAARDDEPDLFHAATGSSDAGRKGDGSGAPTDVNALIRQLAADAR